MWWSLVVPTSQGLKPGICTQKKNLAVLASLDCCVAGPGYGCWPKFDLALVSMAIRFLLNCNAVGWFRSSYFIYVCTLFVKQSLNMEMALIMARV